MLRLSERRKEYLRDLQRVHRLEHPFLIAYACHALWGACYAVTSLDQLMRVPVLAATVANLVPLVAQNVLNAAMDISIDANTPGKSGIARAAERLGRARLIRYTLLEMAFALCLAVGTAAYLGRPLIAASVAAGIVVELLYNLEPIRLKKRGLANPVSLGLHFSFLPCVSTFNAVRVDFPGFVWPLFFGLWLLLIGRTLWWSLPDASADRAAGISPPAVRYGLSRVLALAIAATTGALVLIAWALWWDLGPLASLLGTATCGIFAVRKVLLARKPPAALRSLRDTPMRRRILVLVVSADVLLVVLPLVKAGAHRQ
jgi:4-hydroxybenzoate polyprenyltransferase